MYVVPLHMLREWQISDGTSQSSIAEKRCELQLREQGKEREVRKTEIPFFT